MCHFCQSRTKLNALPETGAFTDTERFHASPKEYTVLGGTISQEALDAVVAYLCDILFVRDADVALYQIDATELFDYIMASVYANSLVATCTSVPVWDFYREYCRDVLNKQHLYRGDYQVAVNTYSIPAHDAEGTKANVLALVKEIARWHNDRMSLTSLHDNVPLPSLADLGNAWVVKGSHVYVGTYPKRVAKFLFKTLGVKLLPQHLETIGNLCSTGLDTDCKMTITFDREYVTRGPDDYIHGGSCWWGGYGNSRANLYMAGGYAVRVWDMSGSEPRPTARCWIMPYNGKYLLMNAYGDVNLFKFARLLSSAWGLSYKQVNMCGSGGTDTMYVNSESGIILADTPTLESIPSDQTFVFTLARYGSVSDLPRCKYCSVTLIDRLTTEELRTKCECTECHAVRYTSYASTPTLATATTYPIEVDSVVERYDDTDEGVLGMLRSEVLQHVMRNVMSQPPARWTSGVGPIAFDLPADWFRVDNSAPPVLNLAPVEAD